MSAPRYAIGIDLGTTNCTLAYIDLRVKPRRCMTLAVPQLQSLRTIAESPLLPSFFYYPTDAQIAQGQLNPLAAPGADGGEESTGYVIGAFAREQMTALPGRVIHSAKSWLAHGGVDREAQILPFASDEIPAELRLSPVEASAAYLDYLKQAWDQALARDDEGNRFGAQRVVVTVPASFDEGAQTLTRMAAEMAGYPSQLRLLEEPQAAFYAWLDHAQGDAPGKPGARLLARLPELAQQPQWVLVCDVGGGTTDFSLFRIAPVRSPEDRPAIERIAASEHLLLGGDNIDLALAHGLERLFKPGSDERVSRQQWSHLVPQARLLKERVLEREGSPDEVFHVSIPGDGASLFTAALDTTVTRARVHEWVLDGFFPLGRADELPRTRKIGLREIGLPYASDSAISRHLAAFLNRQPVDAMLFAGGTLRPSMIQERMLALVESWQGRRPAHLALENMSLAIAQGAAHFAALAEGARERIRGGYPHSVYLELQRDGTAAQTTLVCVMPKGFEEGGLLQLDAPAFDLLVNRPVRFTAYTSSRRPDDAAGTLVTLDRSGFHPLPTLQTTIVLDDAQFNPRTAVERSVRVRIEARLTELGGLQLALASSEAGRHWELEFNLRKPLATESPPEEIRSEPVGVRAETMQTAEARIALFFGKKQSLDPAAKVKELVRDLERIFGHEREHWNSALLRGLWPAVYPGITRRGRSLAHENVWLYLAGFVLRPGYGSDLDPWRVLQLLECFDLGLVHKKEKSARSNWWMMWRRTAGGLSSEHQERLFDSAFRDLKGSLGELVEATRMLGSLERVSVPRKLELSALLIDHVARGKAPNHQHVFWALARLLGRVPLYGAADSVVPAAAVEDYFFRFEALDWGELGAPGLGSVFSAASRRTDVRQIDIHDPIRARVIQKLKRTGARPEQIRMVEECCEVSAAERNDLFGEQLPAGLRLSTA
jgi:molecular chaperone DnaK (HSP70)